MNAQPIVGVLTDARQALEAAHDLVPGLAERAAEHDRAGRFPVADLAAIRASGLLGLMAPRRLGGPGASFLDYSRIAMELASGNGATALCFNMHASVTGALAQTPEALARALGAGDAFFAARDQVLADAVHGAFYAVAMSERAAGARLSQVTTSYLRESGGFRIVGEKTFVSGAGFADAYLVAARAAERETPTISYFLVPAGPGTTVVESWDALGMRATGSHDLHLDVRVGADALLGGVEGLALVVAQLMPQWLVASYAAVYVGVAKAALEAGASYAKTRGLDKLPAVRARIGRADAAVAAAAAVMLDAAARVDEAPGAPETNRAVWRAKLLAGDTAMGVASSMLEAAGSAALRRGHPLERLLRDARCGALQPASSDLCADWLGLAALGHDPDNADVARW